MRLHVGHRDVRFTYKPFPSHVDVTGDGHISLELTPVTRCFTCVFLLVTIKI